MDITKSNNRISCLADVNIQTHFQLEKHIVSKYEHKNVSAKCENHSMDSS